MFFTVVSPTERSGYGLYTSAVVSALSACAETEVHVVGRRMGWAHIARAARTGGPENILVFNHYETARWLPWVARKASTVYVSHNPEHRTDLAAAALESRMARRLLRRARARLRRRVETTILRCARAVSVICEEDARHLAELHRRPFQVVRPTYMSEAPQRIRPRRRAGRLHTGLVGSFHWTPKRLNAEWLIREVLVPVAVQGVPVRLTLAGNGASKVTIPRPLPDRLEIDVHENFASPAAIYQTLDVALSPERQAGGVKIKTIEALVHGVPVIGSAESFRGIHVPPSAGIPCETPAAYMRVLHQLQRGELELEVTPEVAAEVGLNFSPNATKEDAAQLLASSGLIPRHSR